ncbi:hypothetical protein BRADI_2g54795v3 [Brachypodium distachyon]|uniref:Uncharacterized protein n=1 Tax=Brachypodium distachyon TaxID=15368 RepID=A0A2K2DFY8_BRADI|nr:hypothetical protein BRADI_2g54795v3 [Brachypodium distachyon]
MGTIHLFIHAHVIFRIFLNFYTSIQFFFKSSVLLRHFSGRSFLNRHIFVGMFAVTMYRVVAHSEAERQVEPRVEIGINQKYSTPGS